MFGTVDDSGRRGGLVAMSGGVDSSVAAYLAKSRGDSCVGVTLKLFDDGGGDCGEKTCCSLSDVNDARRVAYALDIPFYVYNFTADFKTHVIDRFISAYQNGATPNPCIDCNRYIKFDKLLSRAELLGKDHVVTGHYARIEYDIGKKRHILKKAADDTKDQSYVLYSLTQKQLARTLFPLGALRKSEVREIAKSMGFANADKRDSQDICFVRDGDYARFIENALNRVYEPGNFVDTNGNVLGRHRGIIRYTVGQRKGLGIALQKPMYVRSVNVGDNTVTLCENDALFSKTLCAADFNWIAFDKNDINAPIRVKAKVRYNQVEQPATAVKLPDETVRVDFDEPQRAIARGQAVVLYDEDVVVGGGTIM